MRERHLQRLGLDHLDRHLLGGVRVEGQVRLELPVGVPLVGHQLQVEIPDLEKKTLKPLDLPSET